MKLLGEYGKDTLRIKHPEKVDSILRSMMSDGSRTLQCIADFDYTLTRVHNGNGNRIDCSWGVMENSSLMPNEYVKQSAALKEKYLPYELDPHLSIEEKIPYLVTWYEEANKLLRKHGGRELKDKFHRMVQGSNVDFRDGTKDLLTDLEKIGVPVLILSAGMGDLVKEILIHRDVWTKNINLVSNFLEYDEEGNVKGLKQPMIHVFNKNESSVKDLPYFKDLKTRTNVILMGDSLGDLRMADGIESPDKKVLTIGFLTDKIDERLENYMNNYDIVLVDDQTMDIPHFILNKISNK